MQTKITSNPSKVKPVGFVNEDGHICLYDVEEADVVIVFLPEGPMVSETSGADYTPEYYLYKGDSFEVTL